jgi:hypothetical protein
MQGYYNQLSSDQVSLQQKGILPRTAEFIFSEICRLKFHNLDFKLFFSALEIYNENLYDLLNSQVDNKKSKIPLNLFTNNNDIQIKGLTWLQIFTMEDICKFTKDASESRRSDSTQFNSTSSRSHAVFQIKIEKIKNSKVENTSLINIIDLAGSERSSLNSLSGKTKEEIDLVKRIQNEANFINKSLTTLGRIISLINDKKSAKVAIPYRESKLTMVLQVIICYIYKNFRIL